MLSAGVAFLAVCPLLQLVRWGHNNPSAAMCVSQAEAAHRLKMSSAQCTAPDVSFLPLSSSILLDSQSWLPRFPCQVIGDDFVQLPLQQPAVEHLSMTLESPVNYKKVLRKRELHESALLQVVGAQQSGHPVMSQ